jgi:hypothetical protein
MLVLHIHPDQGRRRAVGHFPVAYEEATPEAVAANPHEILTAVWALCRVHAAAWLADGYTRVTLTDLFRDYVLWDANLVTCLTPAALNGIEWLRNQILDRSE